MGDPKWYRRLSRRARDAWDQTGHFWLGLVIASVGSGAAAWAFFHWREFDQQAPVERIADTQRDMRFGVYGAAVGQVIHTTWTCVLAARIGG